MPSEQWILFVKNPIPHVFSGKRERKYSKEYITDVKRILCIKKTLSFKFWMSFLSALVKLKWWTVFKNYQGVSADRKKREKEKKNRQLGILMIYFVYNDGEMVAYHT